MDNIGSNWVNQLVSRSKNTFNRKLFRLLEVESTSSLVTGATNTCRQSAGTGRLIASLCLFDICFFHTCFISVVRSSGSIRPLLFAISAIEI